MLIAIMLLMLQMPAFAQDADMDGLSNTLDPFPYTTDGDGDGVSDGKDMFPSVRNMPLYTLFSIAFFVLYLIIIRFNTAGYRPQHSQRFQRSQYGNNNIQDTIGLDIESALNIGVHQLRAEEQGGAIHVQGRGTGRRRNILGMKKNNGIKMGDIRKETLCHACKGHEHVKFICQNCGKYYCEQCASDIDEACLVCSNLLSPIK
ncbi:MAG: hypothetical protein KAH86_06365 [Methanosarcinales archaeon]|nr:hypothetical protein [Methanosarcinales archaeon]